MLRRRRFIGLVAVVAAVVVALGVPGVGAPLAATSPETVVTGRLEVGVVDRFDAGQAAASHDAAGHDDEYVYTVRDDAGRNHVLEVDGQPLTARTGSRVRVKGRPTGPAAANLVVERGNAAVEVLQAPAPVVSGLAAQAGSSVAAVSTPADAPATALSLGVVIVKFRVTDGSTALKTTSNVLSASDVDGLFFGGAKSVASYYRQVSGGRMTIGGKLAGTVTINVSGTDATTCSYDNWADQVDAAAAAQGISLSGYTHKAYMLPLTDFNVCNWFGIGLMGGNRLWYARASPGVVGLGNAGGLTHEFGHNLGLSHANGLRCLDGTTAVVMSPKCSSEGYADYFDVMGGNSDDYFLHELSATHKLQLGWLGGALNTITQSGTYELSPSNVAGGSRPKLIRIPIAGGYYDVEYRRPSGTFDSFPTNDPVVNGFSIRYTQVLSDGRIGETMLADMLPQTSTFRDGPFTSGTFNDPIRQVSVRLISRTDSVMTLAVTVPAPAATPTPTPTPTPALKGDLNGDGRIAIADLSILLAGWGKAGASDLNGDGTTSVLDLSVLLGRWTG